MVPGDHNLTERPAFLLSQLGFHVAAVFTRRLEPLGINPRQYGMLTHLARGAGLTQQQLADMLGIHRNVMVSLVDDLENQGLAERHRHPDDRRAYAVLVTEKGMTVLDEADGIADALDAELVGYLQPDGRQSLVSSLLRLAAGVGLAGGVHPGLGHEPNDR